MAILCKCPVHFLICGTCWVALQPVTPKGCNYLWLTKSDNFKERHFHKIKGFCHSHSSVRIKDKSINTETDIMALLHAVKSIASRNDNEVFLLSAGIYLRAISDRAPLFSGLAMQGLPAKFDWRDRAVVAPVQNQLAVRFMQIDETLTSQPLHWNCFQVKWKSYNLITVQCFAGKLLVLAFIWALLCHILLS